MSHRKARPAKLHREPPKPSPEVADGSIISLILLAALGILLSAAFFVLLIFGDNMLTAMTGTELAKLRVPDEKTPAALRHSGPTWNDVYEALRRELAKHPSTPKHNALAQLLRSVVEVERGKQQAAAESARSYLAADPDNLVARLSAASIQDEALGRSRPGVQRFDSFREVVEALPAATASTLHNQEFTDVWRDVLKRYIKREAVALAAAEQYDHYEIVDHHAALPMIRRRMADLASSLRAAGKSREADSCERWVAAAVVGLMRADRDAGTRLLCLDLLAQLPIGQDAARPRRDYYEKVEASPVDLGSMGRTAAADPPTYLRALNTLIASICLTIQGLGAAGLAVFAGVASLWVRAKPANGGATAQRSDFVSRFSAVLLIGLVPAFVIGRELGGGLPSQCWALAVIPAIAALGAILSIAVAAGRGDSGIRRGFIAPAACALMLLLAMAAPPALSARIYQGLGRPLLGFCLVLIALSLVMAVAIIGASVPWRRLSRMAMGVWLLDAALALVFLGIHGSADKHYQEKAVAGYRDEFAARLGADWEQRYLEPLLQSYNAASAAPAKTP